MLTKLKSLVRDEEGASMIEYGLLAALIALVAFAAVKFLGTQVSTLFNNAATSI